jgi:hypothetical protein
MTSLAIQDAILTHCEVKKDRFAVLDSPEVIQDGGVDRIPKPRDSKYGAYYFPWIEVYDPDKGNIFVPPSGHMVGIYARVDAERGVHKAPANEIVRGALGLKYSISRGEQDILNPKGINCIRDFSRRGRGIRVWGARTVSSDASWRYINVRRLFIMIEESIEIGTQWVVFRTERSNALEANHPRHSQLPVPYLANRSPLWKDSGRSLLRQVRRRNQPDGSYRCWAVHYGNRNLPGEAR